jgi:hypothetical protein
VCVPIHASRLPTASRSLLGAVLLLAATLLLCLTAPAPASADSPFSWAVTNVDGSNDLTSVSCPSAALCVSGETGGNVVTSTDPTGGTAAWTVAHASAVTNAFRGMSCASASLCVGVDSAGNVVTSTNPTGGAGAWSTADVAGVGSFNAVSCPSASLCVAVDSAGNVVTSTNPTGGAGAWTVTHVGELGTSFFGVSCPSASLCVAVGSAGNVVTSTNPTGGAGAWSTADVAGAGNFQAVSCPSASLCVATAGHDVATSTNPTGGAGAWSVAHVGGPGDEIFVGLLSVSCPSTSLCVAVDYENDVVTSTNPTGGAAAWSIAQVEKAGVFNAVSCASTSLCVIVDLIGDVVVGTPPVPPAPPVVGSGSGAGGRSPGRPPVVRITGGPPAETTAQRAAFKFEGVSGGAYECSIDAGAWTPCASGASFGPLPPGDHLFRVRETLAGLTGPVASYRWTIDLPRACVLRVARARIFVAPRTHRVRLVIHYTSYRPARVRVSYDLFGSNGAVSLGAASASFSTAGVFRDPVTLSSEAFREVQAARLFKVRFQIAKTPRSCGRYYTKQITIPKKFSGRTVWFQSDSNFAP